MNPIFIFNFLFFQTHRKRRKLFLFTCTLSMPSFSLSDGALDTRANQMKLQLAVSYPDKMNRISLVVARL